MMDLVNPVPFFWLISIVFLLLYPLCLAIYRLFLSPIAHFPGSRLTALTGYYETYLDVLKGGQFTFQIQKWHEQYGPIIRINLNELHVSDPRFHEIAYASNTDYERLEAWRDRFGIPDNVASTVEADLHRRRRAALNPYFSKRQIGTIAPWIQKCVDKLCDRLLNEYKGTARVVSMNEAYGALVTDVIMQYCFGWTYGFLDYPDFTALFTTAFRQVALASHVAGHFRWFRKTMQAIPEVIVGYINPLMIPILQCQNRIRSHVTEIIEAKDQNRLKAADHKNIFSEILASDLPPQEKSTSHLHDEAIALMGAGIESTKYTLSTATFYILNDMDIYQRLQDELHSHFPEQTYTPTLSELERLPYLTAIIQESLRLTHGAAQRLPRISWNKAIIYDKYIIPPGTPFSMSNAITHHDPHLFPDSHSFNPDRWLDNPRVSLPPLNARAIKEDQLPEPSQTSNDNPAKSLDGSSEIPPTTKPLTHYLVAFGRGPRNCLGQNLAWAELYIGLATVFRRVKMELFETGVDAVKMAREYIVPLPKEGTLGVRVKVVE